MLSQNLRKLATLTQFTLTFRHTQKHNFHDVYKQWEKEKYIDSFELTYKTLELKKIIALKNQIAASEEGCIPFSDVSYKGFKLGIYIKMFRFLRLYPSVFEEFTRPKHNSPWFRLTPQALALHNEEQAIYRDSKAEFQERLKRFILMSVEKKLPLSLIQGMLWYLGLPNDYLSVFDVNEDGCGCFKVVERGDGLKWLSVNQTEKDEKMLSMIERNVSRCGFGVSIRLFPSRHSKVSVRGLKLLESFHKLPYVSPYGEECYSSDPKSDLSEKRLVCFFHELFSLFVEHSAWMMKLFCLSKYFRLPQQMHNLFPRHPDVFYMSFKNGKCTVILKEAYYDETAIEAHPLAEVRKKYFNLVKESKARRSKKRWKNCSFGSGEENLKVNPDEEDDTYDSSFVGKRSKNTRRSRATRASLNFFQPKPPSATTVFGEP